MRNIETPGTNQFGTVRREREISGPGGHSIDFDWQKLDLVSQFVINPFANDGYFMPQFLQTSKEIHAVAFGSRSLQ